MEKFKYWRKVRPGDQKKRIVRVFVSDKNVDTSFKKVSCFVKKKSTTLQAHVDCDEGRNFTTDQK